MFDEHQMLFDQNLSEESDSWESNPNLDFLTFQKTARHESREIAIRTDILIYFSGSILPEYTTAPGFLISSMLDKIYITVIVCIRIFHRTKDRDTKGIN